MSDPARYRVDLSPAASRQLRKLPPGDAARLRGPILALALEPRPAWSTKLTGTDLWRLRFGALRVVYAIDDAEQLVAILRVARRNESMYRMPRTRFEDLPPPAVRSARPLSEVLQQMRDDERG